MNLDIRRALAYISEDPRASEKLGPGAVLSLAPILNLAVFALAFIPFVGPLLITLVAAAIGFFLLLVSGHLVGQLLRARPYTLA